MRHTFVLSLLAAAAALPVRAGTVYVPYAIDEVVGSARYRTEITVANRGDSPAQIRTLFISADGVRHSGQTTTIPAHGSSLLASAVPAGAHGYVEVTGPAAMAVSARLLASGHDRGLLSSAAEPIVRAEDLMPSGQTVYLTNLENTAEVVTRLGVVTTGALGYCAFAAYADDFAFGSRAVTGAAAVSRDLAEPLRALLAGSTAGAWLMVTCSTPVYASAVVLATDGRRTAFVAPSTRRPIESDCCDRDGNNSLTKEQIERLGAPRGLVVDSGGETPSSPPTPVPDPPPS